MADGGIVIRGPWLEQVPEPSNAGIITPRRNVAGLMPKQLRLVRDRSSRIIIFRGGYRSGKTTGLIAKAIDLARMHYPLACLVVEPTFQTVKSVFVQTAKRMCEKWKIPCRWVISEKTLYIGGRYPAIIWCRSAEERETLEGLTVGSGCFDEWELYDTEVLQAAMARVSLGPLQQIVLGGTPEGFGPGYMLIEKKMKPGDGTTIIQSSTTDNWHITDAYIERMAAHFSPEQILEKLMGERAQPSGRVYTRFNKQLHAEKPCVDARRGRLEMWCDFNVDPMAFGFVLVDDERKCFHAVGELISYNTDSERHAIEAGKWIDRWKKDNGRVGDHNGTIAICDASGAARSAITPLSHVINLAKAGFKPYYGQENPSVADRVTSVEVVLGGPHPLGGSFPVRLTFDPDKAPYLVTCISSQPRDKDGSPSKEGGLDHGADLIGYGIMVHDPAWAPSANEEDLRRQKRWQKARPRIAA